MSDSEDDGLLFGNMTDADESSENAGDNGKTGTSYPHHKTKLGMDSDSSDSELDRIHSHSNDPVQIKRKTSLRRDKSKKRIKDIDYKSPQITINNTTTTTDNHIAGENNETDHDDMADIEIDPSSPIHSNSNIMDIGTKKKSKSRSKSKLSGFSLNGKKSHKNHHKISDRDSDDEDYDYDEEEHDHINTPKGESCTERMKYILMKLKQNGNIPSMILTVIVIITIFGCFSGHWAAILVFVICYLIYLVECFMNKSWKEMNTNETADATVKLLDTMRKTSPRIEWYVECYHYEETNSSTTDKKTVVWVGSQSGGFKLEELGFHVQYFQYDWNGINYVSERANQASICGIILPDGYEGNRIQKSMMTKLRRNESHDQNLNDDEDEKVAIQIHDDDEEEYEHSHDVQLGGDDYDGDILFFRWNGDIDKLIDDFKGKGIINTDRKKVVTHTDKKTYKYNNWKDISLEYPDFDKHEITKLNITKTYCLSNNETRNDYDDQKQEFLNSNNKDEYQSFDEQINILGFKNCLTIKKQDGIGNVDKNPFWFTIHGYWIYSVLLLTLYPRYKSSTMFGKCSWKIIKSISV